MCSKLEKSDKLECCGEHVTSFRPKTYIVSILRPNPRRRQGEWEVSGGGGVRISGLTGNVGDTNEMDDPP